MTDSANHPSSGALEGVAFVTELARTCARGYCFCTKRGRLGLGSLPRSLVRAMHNRAMSGRLGSIGRPGIFIDVCMHNTSGRE